MTEQEAFREAMTEVYRDKGLECGNLSDEVWSKVEAKLSPKHSKEGAICEVWDHNDCGGRGHEIHVADGEGTFTDSADGEQQGTPVGWNHYQEIPTAQRAYDALVDTNLRGFDETYKRGFDTAALMVRDLISNAMEG